MSDVTPTESSALDTGAESTEATSRRAEQRVVESKAVHILYVSAAMIGVCLTVVGIVNLMIRSTEVEMIVDEALALDSVVFLGACIFAYAAMGAKTTAGALRRERIADVLMMLGHTLMVAVSLLTAYEIA